MASLSGGRNNLPGYYPGTGPGTGPSSLVGAPRGMPPPHPYPFMGPGNLLHYTCKGELGNMINVITVYSYIPYIHTIGGYPYPNYQYPPFNAMVAQHYGVPYAQPHPQQYMVEYTKLCYSIIIINCMCLGKEAENHQ